MSKCPDDWNRVLCMCLSGVGDALTFTPFIRLLKQAKPELQIDVLVMFEASRQMMENNPDVSSVYFVDFINGAATASLSAVLRLRRNRYNATIAACPANRGEYNLIQILLGGRRIGHRYRHYDIRNLNFLKHDSVMEDETRHVVENNVDLLPFCGVEKSEIIPSLHFPLRPADEQRADEWLLEKNINGRRFVGIHAGSALFKNHVNKRWPREKFAALAAELVDSKSVSVLIFGGPEEAELMDAIVRDANRPESVFSVDNLRLPESAALIKRCACMVSNDSALMHISAAVQTPVVAIFGYTNPKMLYPWGVTHKVVRADFDCSPCFYYSPKPASCDSGKKYACIKGLRVETVLEACIEFLDEIV